MSSISTIIFDVDDTLYDVGNGFTAHRNGEAVQRYLVEELGFPNVKVAKELRDSYFEKYHSTAKALTVAQNEGKFPPNTRKFETKNMAEWWAKNCNFSLLGGVNEKLKKDLAECPLTIVAFSNGPRAYVKRVLQELGVWELFGEERLFAVDDVFPHCKPEKEAFEKIFQRVNARPENCVMVEDSMKNIRRAKELGMTTVLVSGEAVETNMTESGARILPGDAPMKDDPAVDVVVGTINEMRDAMPQLWKR